VWWWVGVAVLAELLSVAGGFVVNLLTSAIDSGWAKDPRLLAVVLAGIVLATVVVGAALARHAERADAGGNEPVLLDRSGPRSRSGPAVDARGSSGPTVTGGTVTVPGVVARSIGSVTVQLPPAPQPRPTQVVVGEVLREPLAFQPRDDLMRQVEGALRGVAVAVVCALAGGRGVGKSQLAGAYARRRIAGGCPLVGWVNAETTDQLRIGLAEIAERYGVADPDGDSERSARRLREHLSTGSSEGLLVFDNATDADAISRYAPVASGVEVIATTTDRSFGGLGRLVDVTVYDRAESLVYLGERTGLDDADGAGRVAEELGDSPLALAQAAAVIVARRLPYAEYLALLAGAPVGQVLTRRAGEPYPRGTAEAILVALDAAENTDPTGWVERVLRLLAVLSPDGVPRDSSTNSPSPAGREPSTRRWTGSPRPAWPRGPAWPAPARSSCTAWSPASCATAPWRPVTCPTSSPRHGSWSARPYPIPTQRGPAGNRPGTWPTRPPASGPPASPSGLPPNRTTRCCSPH
jgi:hypothetical protein